MKFDVLEPPRASMKASVGGAISSYKNSGFFSINTDYAVSDYEVGHKCVVVQAHRTSSNLHFEEVR